MWPVKELVTSFTSTPDLIVIVCSDNVASKELLAAMAFFATHTSASIWTISWLVKKSRLFEAQLVG